MQTSNDDEDTLIHELQAHSQSSSETMNELKTSLYFHVAI